MRALSFLILIGVLRGVLSWQPSQLELKWITIVAMSIWAYDIYRFIKRVIKWLKKKTK